MTPEQLADLADSLDKVDLIEDWAKAVRAKAAAMMHEGYTIPGYKLVRGKKGNRAWREGAAESLLAPLGDAAYAPREFVSPAVAEKLFKKVDKTFKLSETHVSQSEGGLHVAPDSDTRPAVVVGQVADEFENLTDEVKDLA